MRLFLNLPFNDLNVQLIANIDKQKALNVYLSELAIKET
jgi:hypothetical protein